jgi:hypothetical protein
MRHSRWRAPGWLIALLSIPPMVRAQGPDDSREKFKK